MNFTSILKIINEKVEPYHSLLAMISFFIITSIAVYKFIVRPQDLSVIIKKQEVNFPNSINEKYDKVLKYIGDSCKNNEIRLDAVITDQYLQNTNNFWIIKLHNETSKSIKGISLKITNVSSLTAWAVNSSYLLDEENKKLMRSLNFEQSSGIIYINKVESLPPNGEIKLYIWGKLSDLNLDENLLVNYEDGDAHVGKEVTLYGFKAYISDFIYEIFLLIFLVYFIVYRHLIKKYSNAAS